MLSQLETGNTHNRASMVPSGVDTAGSLSRRLHLFTEFIKLLLLQFCHDSVEGIDLNGRKRYVNNGGSCSTCLQTPQAVSSENARTASVMQGQ